VLGPTTSASIDSRLVGVREIDAQRQAVGEQPLNALLGAADGAGERRQIQDLPVYRVGVVERAFDTDYRLVADSGLDRAERLLIENPSASVIVSQTDTS
jgi:hypothetical protein